MLRCIPKILGVFGVEPVVVDRRHVERAATNHLDQRRLVEVDRVLERRRARANGVASAVRTVGVDRDTLAVQLRHIHSRLHFLEGEGLIAGDVGAAACRPIHLDVIDPGVDLLLHGFGDLGPGEDASALSTSGVRSGAVGRTRAL